jgi:hypothetical protein
VEAGNVDVLRVQSGVQIGDQKALSSVTSSIVQSQLLTRSSNLLDKLFPSTSNGVVLVGAESIFAPPLVGNLHTYDCNASSVQVFSVNSL